MTFFARSSFRSLAAFCLLIVVVQALGSYTTFLSVRDWYAVLDKAPWTPPNWVFGPVWTVLYISLALIGWRLWNIVPGDVATKFKHPVIHYYFLQLFFNALWSPLFFGMRLVVPAFIDILLMIVLTAALIYHTARLSRFLALALMPYLLWICYAASLNGAIAYLN